MTINNNNTTRKTYSDNLPHIPNTAYNCEIKEQQERKNILYYICMKTQEYHSFLGYVQSLFDKMEIKHNNISPAVISQQLRDIHDAAMKESQKLDIT